MSYRSLDLQVSIPRTPDAAGQMSQLAHKPVADQSRLAEAAAGHTVELRHRNTGVDETAGQTIRDGRPQQGGGSEKRGRGRGESREEPAKEASASHPFKGKHIDISL